VSRLFAFLRAINVGGRTDLGHSILLAFLPSLPDRAAAKI